MKYLLSFLALFYAILGQSQQPVDSRQQEIVFTNVFVVPMATEVVLPNQTVIVKNGLITAVGSKLSYDKNALVIDAKGKFLIPGITEMHAHLPPNDDIEAQKDVLLLFGAKETHPSKKCC